MRKREEIVKELNTLGQEFDDTSMPSYEIIKIKQLSVVIEYLGDIRDLLSNKQ